MMISCIESKCHISSSSCNLPSSRWRTFHKMIRRLLSVIRFVCRRYAHLPSLRSSRVPHRTPPSRAMLRLPSLLARPSLVVPPGSASRPLLCTAWGHVTPEAVRRSGRRCATSAACRCPATSCSCTTLHVGQRDQRG